MADVDLGKVFTAGMWMMLVAALSAGGLLAAKWARRWAQRSEESHAFSLQDLRDMRERGDISEAEFTRLKSEITAVARAGRDRAGPGAGDSVSSPRD